MQNLEVDYSLDLNKQGVRFFRLKISGKNKLKLTFLVKTHFIDKNSEKSEIAVFRKRHPFLRDQGSNEGHVVKIFHYTEFIVGL